MNNTYNTVYAAYKHNYMLNISILISTHGVYTYVNIYIDTYF